MCSRARQETALIYPERLPLSRVASFYAGMDYLLLEGDYHAPVARIVCAHSEKDALPRINGLTLCCAGRISEAPPELPVPVLNGLTETAALLDLIDRQVPDTAPSEALDLSLPDAPGVMSEASCQCGGHQNEKKREAIEVTVGGRPLKLTAERLALIRAWAGEEEA